MGSLRPKRGFTIVELLVVIAIISLLIALLLPAIQAAREAARLMDCKHRFKQLGLAVLNYEAAHGALPLAFTPNWDGARLVGECPGKTVEGNPSNRKEQHNWVSFVLPFFEQQPLYDRIDFDKPWSDNKGSNLRVTTTPLSGLYCPTAPSPDERRGRFVQKATGIDLGVASTDYTVCIDIYTHANGSGFCELVDAGLVAPRALEKLEGMMQDHQPSLRKVTDGLSKTLMLFECAGRPIQYFRGAPKLQRVNSGNWANPESYMIYGLSPRCEQSTLMNCSNWDEIYSFHPGGANFLYGDGAVRFHREDLDLDLFVSLFTRAAEDVLDESP